MYIKLTITVFVFFLITGCSKQETLSPILPTPECLVSQSSCLVNVSTDSYFIKFNRAPIITEAPFKIYLLPINVQSQFKVHGHIEGKEMFMGKIPLSFNDENGRFVAETMLGSCNNEQMIWRIWLTFTNVESKETITRFIDFTSTRS